MHVYTKGIVLVSSGTYNAGQGAIDDAEEDFASAFDLFAPVRQGLVVHEIPTSHTFSRILSDVMMR